MGDWIEEAKSSLKGIVSQAQRKYKVPLRTAFVGCTRCAASRTAQLPA